MVHIGDIKPGYEICTEERYSDVAEMFVHPSNALNYDPRDVLFLPGDNEWSDCYDVDLAWQWWSKFFPSYYINLHSKNNPNINCALIIN